MIQAYERWRRKAWVWAIPFAFVVANLIGLAVFQGRFAGQVEVLEDVYTDRTSELEDVVKARKTVTDFIDGVNGQEGAVKELYEDYFSTEPRRFTTALREIKTLAQRARLNPRAFSYPRERIEAHKLVRRQIVFSVKGSYDQLRTFINLLELTDQFFALEAVSLGGGKDERNDTIDIRFAVSTIFHEKDPNAVAEAATPAVPEEGASPDPETGLEPTEEGAVETGATGPGATEGDPDGAAEESAEESAVEEAEET